MIQEVDSSTVGGNGGQGFATILLYLKCDCLWTFLEGSNATSMEYLNQNEGHGHGSPYLFIQYSDKSSM
jgi:hypothetical protein